MQASCIPVVSELSSRLLLYTTPPTVAFLLVVREFFLWSSTGAQIKFVFLREVLVREF